MLQTIKNLPDRSNLDIFCKEKKYAIYVLDDFSVHLCPEVRSALLKKGYFLVVIGNYCINPGHSLGIRGRAWGVPLFCV